MLLDISLENINYYDLSYFIFILPAVIISLIASAKVKSSFNKYSRIPNSRGLTGAMAADLVLRSYGITNVQIMPIAGNLTDNYNPKTNVISLSTNVYSNCSIAAVGVACHEAGHAVQHALGYGPINFRNALLLPTNIASKAALPIAFAGLILGLRPLLIFGIVLYSIILLFQLVTLPVEFNASSRALKVIESQQLLAPNEFGGAKKVLKAAAMTYVASFAATALSLLRLVLLASGRSKK